jgi:hypothetical protein
MLTVDEACGLTARDLAAAAALIGKGEGGCAPDCG